MKKVDLSESFPVVDALTVKQVPLPDYPDVTRPEMVVDESLRPTLESVSFTFDQSKGLLESRETNTADNDGAAIIGSLAEHYYNSTLLQRSQTTMQSHCSKESLEKPHTNVEKPTSASANDMYKEDG